MGFINRVNCFLQSRLVARVVHAATDMLRHGSRLTTRRFEARLEVTYPVTLIYMLGSVEFREAYIVLRSLTSQGIPKRKEIDRLE